MDDELQRIISQTQSAAGTATPTPREGAPANPVIEALTSRLRQQGQGISSSASSNIQSEIKAAMGDVTRAGEATGARLQSERQREVGFAQDRAGAQITGAMEARSGFATQVAGLRELTDTTEKSIRDLDQRYQEAILTNDANTATQLSQLRMQKLEFLQQQEQDFFSNLMQTAALQEQQASREQEFSMFERGMDHEQQMMRQQFGFDWAMVEKQAHQEERNMVLGLAAEYGVEVGENETIESMIQEISPLVTQERALQLARIKEDINRAQAETQRALAGARRDNERLNKTDIDAMAGAYRRMPEGSQLLMNLSSTDQGQVIRRVNEMDSEELRNLVDMAEGYTNIAEFERDLMQSGTHWSRDLVDRAALTIVEPAQKGLLASMFGWGDRDTKTRPVPTFDPTREETLSAPQQSGRRDRLQESFDNL